MPTSKPRKNPSDFKKKSKTTVSAAAAFKKNSARAAVMVELPSGNVVKVQRIDIASLLTDNIIPDTLTALVQSSINPKGKDEGSEAEVKTQVEDVMQDPKKIKDLFEVFDKIAARIVIEPQFVYHMQEVPDLNDEDKTVWEVIPEEARDDDLVYTDEVTFEDKSFLFQYSVGGTADLERFRAETGAALGSLEHGESVSNTSE